MTTRRAFLKGATAACAAALLPAIDTGDRYSNVVTLGTMDDVGPGATIHQGDIMWQGGHGPVITHDYESMYQQDSTVVSLITNDGGKTWYGSYVEGLR